MNIYCSVTTDKIRDLAADLGFSTSYTNNLVSTWQTTNATTEYPTLEQLKEFKSTLNKDDILLNYPLFSTVPYTNNSKPVQIDENNRIILTELPQENGLKYFFSKFENAVNTNKLRELITSKRKAYNYILWREMAFIQNGYDRSNPEHIKLAENEALQKAAKYKNIYPNSDPVKNIDKKEDSIEITYTPKGKSRQVYTIKGSHIYNKNNEEVFANPGKDRNRIFANRAIKLKEAVVVEHKGENYVVNKRGDIISVKTGNIMKWDADNGDRKAIIDSANIAFSNMISSSTEPTSSEFNTPFAEKVRKVKITSTPYSKMDPINEPNTAFVFNENAQAYAATHRKMRESTDPIIQKASPATVTLDVKDYKNTNRPNTAGIRSDDGISQRPNVFGIVVKKYQQLNGKDGIFAQQEGAFNDTPEDFNMFVAFNLNFFEALDKFMETTDSVKFPGSMAMGRAALPKVFAEWLSNELRKRYGIISVVTPHEKSKYTGYGLVLTGTSTDPNVDIKVKQTPKFTYTRSSNNGYEVSSAGDKRFSAFNAIFKEGTIIDGEDVSGKSIEYVYQNIIKKSGKGKAPAENSKLNLNAKESVPEYTKRIESLIGKGDLHDNIIRSQIVGDYILSKEEIEDFSYYAGYLPLWKEWAKQNPELINELRIKAKGKTLTDKFASTRVSQARALADILNEGQYNTVKDKVENYTLLSGGAYGADTDWHIIGKEFGEINAIHYRPSSDNSNLSKRLRDIKAAPTVLTPEELKEAKKKIKEILDIDLGDSKEDNLKARNYYQVANSDGVFAIGRLDVGGSFVSGGTNIAVQLGIKMNKPVYVWNINTRQWYMYNPNSNSFELSDTPVLTKNFAGVGTRDIENYNIKKDGKWVPRDKFLGEEVQKAAEQAIRDVYEKTLSVKSSVNVPTTRVLNSDEAINVANNLPEGSTDIATNFSKENVVRSFATPSEDSLIDEAIEQEAIMQSYEEELPPIGNDVLSVNTNNAAARIVKDFSPMERRDRVVLIARKFTDKVNEYYEKKIKEIKKAISIEISKKEDRDTELISSLTSKLDQYENSNTGRQSVIEAVTVETIFKEIKEEFQEYADMSAEELDEDYGEGEGVILKDKYQRIVNNFEELLDEACSIIENKEGVRLFLEEHDYNDGKNKKKVLGATMQKTAEEITKQDDEVGDSEDGKRVSGNDGFSYHARMIDPRTTLSKTVKSVLSNIIKLDNNGQAEHDDLGNSRYIDPEYAHAVLLNELAEMIDANDFSKKLNDSNYQLFALERIAMKYPWVNQIINSIKNNPSAISSFFTDFRKDFISYWINKNGESIPMNKAIAADSAITTVLDNYRLSIRLDDDAIYSIGNDLDKEKAEIGSNLCNEVLTLQRDLEDDDVVEEIAEKTSKVLRMVGFESTPIAILNLYNSEDGKQEADKVIRTLKSIFDGVKKLPKGSHMVDTFRNEFRIISQSIGEVIERNNIQTFMQAGKTYPSYAAPNFADTLIKILKNDSRRQQYLDSHYKRDRWFYDPKKGWMNEWARIIEENEDVRFQISTKNINYLSNDEITGFPTPSEYAEWTPPLIQTGFISEYFSIEYNPKSEIQYGMYNFPIFSDSEMAMFIKFVRYTGDFKSQLIPLLSKVVEQELFRINRVQNRRANGIPEISNYDKNGDKFFFFPQLNANDGKFLKQINDLKEKGDIEGVNELIQISVLEIMEDEFVKFRNSIPPEVRNELKVILANKNVISTESEEELDIAIEEYFWNQSFATSQIIQLTTVDLAFYKDATDFQKRFKEVFASGNKLNTNSIYGREVERTVYLKDDIITSSSFNRIEAVLDAAVISGKIQSYDRDNILYKFKDVNVADAQAYRSLSSYRAILDMLGVWDDKMQTSFDNITSGNWNMEDFNTVWQTIKPFVFTNSVIPSGIKGDDYMMTPIQNKNSEFLLLATYQMIANSMGTSPKLKALNKFMEDNNIDVVQFESAVKAGKQGIIDLNYSQEKLNKVLKENPKYKEPVIQKRIDKIEKLYKDGKLTEDEYKDEVTSAKLSEVSYEEFKDLMDDLLSTEFITQDYYNNIFNAIDLSEEETLKILNTNVKRVDGSFNPYVVHELSYNDYMVQQPTPEHLFDVEAVFGSQFRNLIVSDLPEDFEMDFHGRKLNKQQTLDLYKALITENLLEDFNVVSDRFKNIEDLQKELLRQVKGNSKYNRDMVKALDIVEITTPSGVKEKVFNIPFNNPSTTNMIQELVNSMFKNKVTKQHIKGGACILVSDFGLTKELNIVFKNSRGEELTREWYDKNVKDKEVPYEKWVKQQLDSDELSIAGIECYLPAYSKKLYEPFMVTKTDSEGNTYQELDVEKMPDDLKRIIGYRIPTEDKYSMAPLIIKGFLPQQNGSAIMVPADITVIAGSDFDVDKMFLMIPEFKVRKTYRIKDAWDTFYKDPSNKDIVDEIDANFGEALDKFIQEQTEDWEEDPDEDDLEDFEKEFKQWLKSSNIKKYSFSETAQAKFKEWFNDKRKEEFFKKLVVKKINAKLEEGDNYLDMPKNWNRKQRNNMLIDLSYGILTHPDTASKILNPGNYDSAKRQSRIAKIANNPTMIKAFKELYKVEEDEKMAELLLNLPLDDLNKFVKKYSSVMNPLSLNTFIYYHKQNMTGGALIGMYANNTSMQAKYQALDIYIKDKNTFIINDRTIKSLSSVTSENGERISKNCATFSASSVDNVKDPVLADLLQNTKTANVTAFMLRAGMSVEEINLLFNQPLVKACIDGTGSLKKLKEVIESYLEANNIGDKSIYAIHKYKFTSKELLENILFSVQANSQSDTEFLDPNFVQKVKRIAKSAILMMKISNMAESFKDNTKVSRADSPNGAIAPSLATARNQVRRLHNFRVAFSKDKFPIGGLDRMIDNDYLDLNMSIDDMRSKLLHSSMSVLQGFYSLGIDLPLRVMARYFPQNNKVIDGWLDFIYDNSPKGIFPDDSKIVKAFYDELVEFGLTKTKLFGNDDIHTYDEKRNYYLYKYPFRYLKVLKENPDIANLNIFRKIVIVDGEIVMERSSRLTQPMSDALIRDFDTLLYMDNPEAQRLAIDLFMYSFYKDGLRFGPNSIGKFFSSTFLSSFPEFINTLRSMSNDVNEEYYKAFLPQFYNNHRGENIVKQMSPDSRGENNILINKKACINNNVSDTKFLSIIDVSDELYVINGFNNEYISYVKLPNYNDPTGHKYNANMSIDQMATIKPDNELIENVRNLNAENKRTSLENSIEPLTEFEEGYDMENILDSLEEEEYDDISVEYSEEDSEKELGEKLCNDINQ